MNILVIEDNPAMQGAIKLLIGLRFPQSDIMICSNGADGVEIFKRAHFDIVILDINLPDVNGLDLLPELRKSNSNTAIIILSLYIHPDWHSINRNLGVIEIIDKSEMTTKLIPAIEQVVFNAADA
jgi:DNA-binding response OmpR family regulator